MKGILISVGNRPQVEMLTDDEAGVLFKAIFAYVEDGTVMVTENRTLAIVFSVIRTQIDIATEKYTIKCEKNREIALERERRKQEESYTNVHERTRTYTNVTNNNNNKNKKEKENKNIKENIDINKDKSLCVANATAPARKIDYDAILAFWNEQMEINGANIPKIREMSNDRKRWIRARFAECKNGIEDIKLVIQKAAVSDFMNRRCDGSWLADFDWIFEKKRNFEKVLGKRYDNEENVKPLNTPNHGTSRRDIEEMQRRDEAAALVARLIAENE